MLDGMLEKLAALTRGDQTESHFKKYIVDSCIKALRFINHSLIIPVILDTYLS